MVCTARANGSGAWIARAQRRVDEPLSLSGAPDSSLELLGEPADGVVGLRIGGDPLGRTPAGVQDRGVVAAAERAPDRRQRLVGQVAREVHGYLARPGHGAGPA